MSPLLALRPSAKLTHLAQEWDLVAEHLSAGEFTFRDEPARQVLEPALRSMIGPVRGLHVLDAGCGDGWLTNELLESGAKVTAVDFSPRMIELARSRNGARARLDIQDISKLDPEIGPFDLIVCNMVLMDVSEIDAAFASFRALMTDSSRLVWTVLHPCFMSLNDRPGLGWQERADPWTPKCAETKFLVDQYFNRGELRVDVGFTSISHFHRPLEDYLKAIKAANLQLSELREPASEEEPTSRVGYYLIVECRPA